MVERHLLKVIAVVLSAFLVLSLFAGQQAHYRLNIALAFGVLACVVILVVRAREESRDKVRVAPHSSPARRRLTGSAAIALAVIGTGLDGIAGAVLVAAGALLALYVLRFRWTTWWVAIAIASPLLIEIISGSSRILLPFLALGMIGTVIAVWMSATSSRDFIDQACAGTAVYLAIALGLYFAGVHSPYYANYLNPDLELSAFGPFPVRFRMPLASSWTHGPLVAIMSGLLSFWIFLDTARRPRAWAMWAPYLTGVVVVLSAVVIVGANGRTFIFVGVAAIVLVSGILGRWVNLMLVLIAQAAYLAPLWWEKVVGESSPFGIILQSLVPSRQADGAASSVLTLEGRTKIWDLSMGVWNGGDWNHKLLGWGPDGYIPSGAEAAYRPLLSAGYANAQPPHSAFLDLLFSSGIVGVVTAGLALALLLIVGVGVILTNRKLSGLVAAAMFTIATLTATEVAFLPSIANPALVTLLVGVLVVIMAAKENRSAWTRGIGTMPASVELLGAESSARAAVHQERGAGDETSVKADQE